MKKRSQLIVITLLLFVTTSCVTQNKKENTIRNLSLEECYEKNLTDSTLMTGWYYVSNIDSGFVRQLDKTDEFYIINPLPILTAEDITTLSIEKDNRSGMYLSMKFGKAGAELWRIATGKNIGGKLAFIVNDKLISTPQVNVEVKAGATAIARIDYSKEDYDKVKQTIENNKAEIQKDKSAWINFNDNTNRCYFVELNLPVNSYEKPNKNRVSYTYYDIDRAKKNADRIINLSLSERTNIDSLFLVLDNYKEIQLNDSLENEKWIGICMKIPQMPLNIFSKIMCNIRVKDIKRAFLDLRYDEFIVFFCNKKNIGHPFDMKLYSDFNEKEYTEYLKNADYNALENMKDLTKYRLYRYIFRTISSEILPTLFESETVENFYWNNNNNNNNNIPLQVQLDSLDNLISDFKNEFQETIPEDNQVGNLIHPNCNRKALSVHFPNNIPLTEIIQIMNISQKSGLIYEVDCVENRLNIYTLCYKNELQF